MPVRASARVLSVLIGLVLLLLNARVRAAPLPLSHRRTVQRATPATEMDAVAFAPVNASIWRFASAWQLSQGTQVVSICPSPSVAMVTPHSVVFAVFQLQPLDRVTVDAAIENATHAVNTFSSASVERVSVEDGDELAFDVARTRLYQVQYESDDDDEDRCVETTMTLQNSALYLVVATQPASSVTFAIRSQRDVDDAAQPVVQCFVGCASNDPVTTTTNDMASGTQAALSPSLHTGSGVASAVAASLLVSLSSLGGVAVLRVYTTSSRLVDYMTTFAAGCLVGVVVFHLLPEGSEKLTGGDGVQGSASDAPEWLPGAYVLLGVLLSLAIEVQVHVWLGDSDDEECLETGASHRHHHHGHSHGHRPKLPHDAQDLLSLPTHTPTATSLSITSIDTLSPTLSDESIGINDHVDPDSTRNVQAAGSQKDAVVEIDQETDAVATSWRRRIKPLAWMTAIGDFCHAFTDGVVLAVAFQSCSTSLGWAVALGILLHEVPHRIGDFFVFLRAGMSVYQALIVNFLASGGSLAGVLVIFSLGSVSEVTLGAMLAIGAGSLLFIALSELLPPVLALHDQKAALAHLAWFVLGGTLIWLSALREVECDV